MDRNRPLIGIAAYEVPASFSHWHDVECAMVPAGYVKQVVAAGGMPLIVPPVPCGPASCHVCHSRIYERPKE
jgi:gamma-glutamyl-gamma-aminobutyrate hydrolase PuuD